MIDTAPQSEPDTTAPAGDGRGWFAIRNDTLEKILAPLGDTAIAVYCVLSRRSDASGRCWPSHDDIAQMAGTSRSSAIRALAALEHTKAIRVVHRPGSHGGNEYQIQPCFSCANMTQDGFSPVSGWNSSCVKSDVPPVSGWNTKKTQRTRPKKKTHAARAKWDAAQAEIPRDIDTPELRDAWLRWVADRKERRKPITQASAKNQLSKLARWGASQAIASIERSIEAGWTRLFPPDPTPPAGRHNGNGQAPARPSVTKSEEDRFRTIASVWWRRQHGGEEIPPAALAREARCVANVWSWAQQQAEWQYLHLGGLSDHPELRDLAQSPEAAR